MDRYAEGDAHAFSALHQGLYPRLHAYLTRMSGSPTLADDLVQETFLRMHRARASFVAGGAVIPWAYAIARNVHIDHTRAAKLRRTERLPSDPGAE
ncbi:MAG TPA: sigma factor, partial [Minicystis sp.]|nr:sigma factor [Minicystis sp.]